MIPTLDLSNNNATGHNFARAYHAGQRRLYLKRCEHVNFVDRTYPDLRGHALAAGFQVGAYDFVHPLEATPLEAMEFFLGLLVPLKPGRDLRPCLDVEYGSPSAKVGQWVTQAAKHVVRHTGVKPVIYGNGWYLEACKFKSAPGPLWLAAYGRNDGREYPVGRLPSPWKQMAAHQYTSQGHCVGINGPVDISRVFSPDSIDVPPSATQT